MLIGYHNFSSTVQNIKDLILKRTRKDNISIIHFGGFAHKLMIDYFKRIFSFLKRPKVRKIMKNKGSGISTDE